jgi:hypothetical protein
VRAVHRFDTPFVDRPKESYSADGIELMSADATCPCNGATPLATIPFEGRVMSMLEGLSSTLADMGFAQLSLLFLAVGAYSIAINGSFGGSARSGAASASFASSVAFSTLAPSWMSGVVFLALAVLAIALFAAASWLAAAMLGLGAERGAVIVDDERTPQPAPALQTVRGLAAGLIRLH